MIHDGFRLVFSRTLCIRIKQAPEKIYEIVGDKINAEDMDPRILAIYSIFELNNGNNGKSDIIL